MSDIEAARVRLNEARAAYLDALRQDCDRPEGSGAQEKRNDAHLESLRDALDEAQRAFNLANSPGA